MPDWLVTVLIAGVAAVPGIGALLLALRKAPAESRSMNGDAAVKYAQAAHQAAEDIIDKSERIGTLETMIDTLKAELTDMRCKVEMLEAALKRETKRAQAFEKWARALYEQARKYEKPISYESVNGAD